MDERALAVKRCVSDIEVAAAWAAGRLRPKRERAVQGVSLLKRIGLG